MFLKKLLELLFILPTILIAVIVHEYAHGWAAYKLGDETPKTSGRLTLDPLKHIDPIGTILVPILLLITSNFTFTFGWAKPVPVNFLRFKNIRKGLILVSLAGPLSNLLLALVFALIYRFLIFPFPVFSSSYLEFFTRYMVIINSVLAIFNLIPIPPLDGSKILYGIFLKYPQDVLMNPKIDMYGMIILVILLFFGVIGKIINPILTWLIYLLLW
ncbi:MAG: site-2 protease family protein [Candidatus Thorarchaeota archaeon]|nr:MAG: site-2 protease family protein [Candidatus Thorarchaeota archaeon]HDJ99898.1 site-2 protease family protein [Bacillota bacterium]